MLWCDMNKLDRLIEILCEERGEKAPTLSEERKADFFRALCNVRPPKPISDEFLILQDEYLSELRARRGMVPVSELCFRNGIALWQGDITRLEVDAIVNACNSALLGCFVPLHNCIDNVIHSNAGVQVRLDCARIMQGKEEPNGSVQVTKGYNLPSRYIFHTVGPVARGGSVTRQNEKDLKNCYLSCLNKADEMNLKSIAFCCISTGVFGYPKEKACKTAVETVRRWKADGGKADVVFDVFDGGDKLIYQKQLSM